MAAVDKMNITQFSGPEGNQYTAPNGKTYTMQHGPGGTEAYTAPAPKGRRAGRISTFGGSEPENQTIRQITVSGPHRRKGLATALMDYQRLQQPDLHHSAALTASGKQFAAATPREWQPTLTAGDYPGHLSDVSTADWGRRGSRNFDKKNRESTQRWRNEQADETRAKQMSDYNAEHHEQLRLF